MGIQEIPEGWTVFVYTLQGEFQFGDQRVSAHHTVLFQQSGGGVRMINVGRTDGHLVLIAGKPIGEPVVQRGPFVMCTQTDLEQAFNDYRHGKNVLRVLWVGDRSRATNKDYQ